MRVAKFKKTTGGAVKLKDIDNKIVFLNKDETIVAHYEKLNGFPGIEFLGFVEEDAEDIEVVEPIMVRNGNVFNIVKTPTMEDISNIKPNTPSPEPPDNPNADKDCKKCKGRGKYSFGGAYGSTIHWSVCECVMFKPEPPPKPEIRIGFDPETLKSLKQKTPREWMLIKKHEIKKIMDDAGIDYSQIEDDRMLLYKFLFSIIKDL